MSNTIANRINFFLKPLVKHNAIASLGSKAQGTTKLCQIFLIYSNAFALKFLTQTFFEIAIMEFVSICQGKIS